MLDLTHNWTDELKYYPSMETEGSVLFFKEPAAEPCRELVESSPYCRAIFI
jgi:hypothetical protein